MIVFNQRVLNSSDVFSTYFKDGEMVSTTNSSIIVPWPGMPGKQTVSLPDIKDPKALYQKHLRYIMPILKPTAPPDVARSPRFYQMELEMEVRKHWVNTGYFYLDEENGVYRPTWKGAFLMSWRLLPPWKNLIRRKLRKVAIKFYKWTGLCSRCRRQS